MHDTAMSISDTRGFRRLSRLLFVVVSGAAFMTLWVMDDLCTEKRCLEGKPADYVNKPAILNASLQHVQQVQQVQAVQHVQYVQPVQHVQHVLILSYQRCGSSLFGSLLDRPQNGMYVFEPLDSLYQRLYSTIDQGNHPADIRHWPNGTTREISGGEMDSIELFLRHIFTCNVKQLITEFFVHSFWRLMPTRSMAKYVQCYKTRQPDTSLPLSCGVSHDKTDDFCSARKNAKSSTKPGYYYRKECLKQLWHSDGERRIGGFYRTKDNSAGGSRKTDIESCIEAGRDWFAECEGIFEKKCRSASQRVIKLVRAPMRVAGRMLASLSPLKVIHLVRAPKAVAFSRSKYSSLMSGAYERGNRTRVAELFCEDLREDIEERQRLQRAFPGRVMGVNFDDVILKPKVTLRAISQFLQVDLNPEILAGLGVSAKKSPERLVEYKSVLSRRDIEEVESVCSRAYSALYSEE